MATIATNPSTAPADSRMPFMKKKLPGANFTHLPEESSKSGDTPRDKIQVNAKSPYPRDEIQVMLECPHCTEIYRDPQILTCQHSLCRDCIEQTAEGDVVECPVCKAENPLTDIRDDINKQQLIAIMGEESKKTSRPADSDSDFDSEDEDRVPHCEVCDKPIQWHCEECKQWICNECKSKHVKFKATRGHKLEHIVAVSKEHRGRLETQYKDIQKAEEKLHAIISKAEDQIRDVQGQEAEALKQSNLTRQEWLRLMNQRFDEVDVKITDFVSNRVTDLQLLKTRSEVLLLELAEKTAFLSGFLTNQPPVIVTRGGKISSDMDQYLALTTIPRVEFKEHLVRFKAGTKFEPKAVANYELKGSHSQVNVPILLKNILKHADAEVVAPLPAPRTQPRKVPLPKSKAVDHRVTEGSGEVVHESQGISNIVTKNREDELGGRPQGPQEKQIIPRSQRQSAIVKNITRDTNYTEDFGRLTPRVTPAPGNTSRSRLSRKTPVPKAVFFDSLRQLMRLRYHLDSVVTLKTKPVSIKYIHKNIWCCQGDVISIWNIDFEELQTIEHGMLKQVQSVAQLKSGCVAVATGAGLHLLGAEGQYNGRVSDECYMDVDTCDNLLYAVLFGAVTRAKMHIYDEDKPWDIQRSVVLPSDGLVTINVSSLEGMIYVCSHDHGVVYVTTSNGEVIRRCGRKGVYGGAGHFNKPRICHGDMDGSLLVADKRNQCLQVHNIDGEWMVVQLAEKPERPACAAFIQRQLFVLQTEGSWKIMKYTT